MPPEAQPQPSQAQGQPQPGGPQGPADQHPKWISLIPDESAREEARQSYLLHSDYTKKTQALSAKEKEWDSKYKDIESRYNEVADWYSKEYLPWIQKYKPYIDRAMSMADKPQSTVPQNGQTVQQADDGSWLVGWDGMTAQEQATRLYQKAINDGHQRTTNLLTQWTESINKAYMDDQTKRQQEFIDMMDAFFDAMERRSQYPELDPREYLKTQLEIKSGKRNPREVALTLATLEKEKEKLLEEGRKQGREAAEKEFNANKPQVDLTLSGGGVPTFRHQVVPRGDRMRDLSNEVTKRFGQKVW